MALAEKLRVLGSKFDHPITDARARVVRKTLDEWMVAFDPAAAVQAGDRLPDFVLQDSSCADICRASLLASMSLPSSSLRQASNPLQQPPLLLINFIRGEWCGFCKIQLRELARRATDFAAANVRIVIISPELSQFANSTQSDYFSSGSGDGSQEAQIPVLADVDNKLARQLGLVWAQPSEMYPVLADYGHDVPGRNGNYKYEVPVPPSLLVDSQGAVRRAHIDKDFMKRLEPDTALAWVEEVRHKDK